MEAGLDTGPVRLEERTPIDGKTAGQLTDELAAMGARLMVRVLADLGAFPPVPQPEEGLTYASKIDKAETRLDFTQSAEQVERQVRAFSPIPGAFFELDGERFRVLSAEVTAGSGVPGTILEGLTIACASGAIRPLTIQRAGRGVMTSDELLRGFSVALGTQL
jgi:methionyl-tRNA formyltransferase